MTASSEAPRLILGSGSPRRLDLLAQIGLVPDVVHAPDIDEAPLPGELPRPYCARMAREKSEALPVEPRDILLTADTTVYAGRSIIGKPADAAEAGRFLARLAGRRHKVVTAIAVRTTRRIWVRDMVSTVKMKSLSPAELDAYVDTGEWRGKAGGYGIQGPAAAFVPWIQGSYSAIMGLPLAETATLLRAAGLRVELAS